MMIKDTTIEGVKVICPDVYNDSRGSFMESWNRKTMVAAGIDADFVQDNISVSYKGVLRGVHTQLRFPQSKLVSCLNGRIYDVAVDCRKDSPTFGKWYGEYLSFENRVQMFIPAGVAHAFYAVEDSTVQMKVTTHYVPGDEIGFSWNDSLVSIEWPFSDSDNLILAEKDMHWGSFKELVSLIDDYSIIRKENSVIH